MTNQTVKIEIDQQEAKELASTLIAIMLTTSHDEALKLAIKIAHQLVSQIADSDNAMGLLVPLTMIETMGPAQAKKIFEKNMAKTKPNHDPYDQTKN